MSRANARSQTGPGGLDLSLSELEPPTTSSKPRFSLFAEATPDSPGYEEEEQEFNLELTHPIEPESEVEQADETIRFVEQSDRSLGKQKAVFQDEVDDEAALEASLELDELATPKQKQKQKTTPTAAPSGHKSREDQLRATLYSMRKLNASFDTYISALQATQAHNEVPPLITE